MHPVGTAVELERHHRRAIVLLRQNERPSVIVRILGITKTFLYRWRNTLERVGPQTLDPEPPIVHPGLSDEQLARLANELQKGTIAHG